MAAKPVPSKRSDGSIVWRQPFRLTPGGKVTHETFTTAEDAARFGQLVDKVGGQAARDARTATTIATHSTPTLGAWFEKHLSAVAASATPGTVDDYRSMAARTWLPHLGHLPLTAVTRPVVSEWVRAQRSAPTARSAWATARARQEGTTPSPTRTYSPKSIANAHGLLSAVLAYAVDEGELAANPAQGVRLPTDSERTEIVIIVPDEFEKVRQATLNPIWQLWLEAMYGTGARFGEATAWDPSDLDTRGSVATIRVARAWKVGERGRRYLGSPKTRRGRRVIPIPDTLAAGLSRRARDLPAEGLLFSGPRGGRLTSDTARERIWLPALKAAGIITEPRIHDLRHSHASMMLAAGMTLVRLQYRLGHESIKTTVDRYGHLVPGELEADAKLAATMFRDQRHES